MRVKDILEEKHQITQESCFREELERNTYSIEGFFAITTAGTTYWKSVKNILESNKYFNKEWEHFRGMKNSVNELVIGGRKNFPNSESETEETETEVEHFIIIYKMENSTTFTPEKFTLDTDYDPLSHFPMCFFETDTIAVCCASYGQLFRYNSELTPPNWTLLDNTQFAINTCMKLENGNIAIGGSDQGNSRLKVIDPTSGSVKYNKASTGVHYIRDIAEVKPNILITAEINALFLYDYLESGGTIAPRQLSLGAFPISLICSLVSLYYGEGFFAFGGREDMVGGKVYIYNLMSDNQTISHQKSLGGLGGVGCIITTLKEVKDGSLIIAGDQACEYLCVWNYNMLLPNVNEETNCWKDLTSNTIMEIVPALDE